MIFLTVGTLFPFDRLIGVVDSAIADGVITEPVFGQIGENAAQPVYFESVPSLGKEEFDARVELASGIISHAGMGNIFMAIDLGKPIMVMPRMRAYGEHVNDHQVATAKKFEQLGHVIAAYCEQDLRRQYARFHTFVPKQRSCQTEEVAERIACFLQEV